MEVTKLYQAKEVRGIQEIKKEIKKIKQTKDIKQDCLTFKKQWGSNFFLHVLGTLQILT